MQKAQIGLIGLGVMGGNLIKNIESRGYTAAVYNRTSSVTDEFMAENKGRKFVASKTLPEFIASLEKPRRACIMVKAGKPVDDVVAQLMPLLEPGDMIIELGNSFYRDTQRREKECKTKGVMFVGVGVSGGEEGALKGPSIMPGGDIKAWEVLKPMFEKIAAQVDGPCVTYIGPDGAGHFVKMVHNGIEYADMQLIAEAYDLQKRVLGLNNSEIAAVFEEWNQGVLSSFLIEITAKVLKKQDDRGQGSLVDKILDKAQQKGTGKWTVQDALDYGVPMPAIAGAVDARNLSALKEERVAASKELVGAEIQKPLGSRDELIKWVHDALYCSKIVAYAQGLAMMRAASLEHNWNLKLGNIAAIWKGGCIIRAKFLGEIKRAYDADANLANLLLDPFMKGEIAKRLQNWRRLVALGVEQGIPMLGFATSLAYYDSYRSANLPQNLTQAQRDFFGAHTYERNDMPGSFHTEW